MALDAISRVVLRELCMNSRVEMTEIAKKANCSRLTVAAKMKHLEKEAGLKYTVELNEKKLGFSYTYLIQVNLRKSVSDEVLVTLSKSSSVPQFIAACRGAFNLLIFAAAKNNIDYLRWEYTFRSKLRDAIAEWKPSQVVIPRLGFFPFQRDAIESSDLPAFEKKLLAELCADTRLSYRELAKKLDVSTAKIRYNLNLLEKSGIIKRFTAVMQKPPAKAHIVYFYTYRYQEGYEERCKKARHLITTEEPFQPCNTYAYVAELSGHADEVAWACFDDVVEGYEKIAEEEKIFEPDEVRTDSAIVTRVIYGDWPIRSIDVKKAYDTSSWED